MKRILNWRLLMMVVVAGSLAFSGPMALAVKGGNGKGQGQADVKKKGPFSALSGQVTNNLSGAGLAGVSVAIGPYSAVTGASGAYLENKLPVGCYDVSVDAVSVDGIDYSAAASQQVCVNKSFPAVLDIGLDPDPNVPVVVELSVAGDAVPGATLAATVSIKIQDGSMLQGTAWSWEGLGTLTPDTTTAEVALAPAGDFKHELITLLKEPPISEAELPPNVPPPPGEFVGGLQDRFQAVGINPFALERAGEGHLEVCVTTSSGEYCDAAAVHAHLPWAVTSGLRNVPVDVAVLLHGEEQGSYDWTIAGPGGSTAELTDPMTQNPEFKPDLVGNYTVTENVSMTELVIHAGAWRGVIVGQDLDRRPISDPACTGCHNDVIAPDKFTPWAQTGHAEIFTNNLNTSPYWGPQCFGCHTVGFNLDAANGGSDDAFDYEAFLQSGLLGNPDPENWSAMVGPPGTTFAGGFQDTAQLANIQCENCHGPQNTAGTHFGMDQAARVDLSSDVCAQCHGEPLRHARFQQWQLSRHSNYELAIDEGQSTNCSRCHTSNGFLAWLPVLLDDDPLTDPTASLPATPWTEDETHPQVCVTCHDPHNIGTSSGNNTNAIIRISDNTPLLTAGFTALGVGKGAMCMTCHNSRRGLRNEDTWAATMDKDRSPHGGVQTDLLMGQNAYFIDTGDLGSVWRGKHSIGVEDTCVGCHMQETDPPPLLAYNLGGTNHTFFASVDICSSCHGEGFTADGVQAATHALIEGLDAALEAEYVALIEALLMANDEIDVNGDASIVDANDIEGITMSHTRGRQALVIELTGGVVVGPTRLSDIDVIPAGTTLLDEALAANEDIVKAGWNRNLVEEDASLGIHNPSYSVVVLQAAIDALTP